MSKHRAERTPAPRRAARRRQPARRSVPARNGSPLRLVLGVGALATAGVLAFGGQGTFAYWNDTATVNGTGFTSGKLDLTVDGDQGNPTAYAKSGLTMTAMVPGESVAATLSIANVGNADFTWTATPSKTGPLATPLAVDLFLGGQVTGNATGYPRQQTCSGTPITASTATRLAIGGTQTLCVKVTLPTSTGDGFQNQTAPSTVTLALAATQVTS